LYPVFFVTAIFVFVNAKIFEFFYVVPLQVIYTVELPGTVLLQRWVEHMMGRDMQSMCRGEHTSFVA